MKILILTSNYPRIGALNSGIFIHQQVKALQQLGVECHVLCLHNWYPAFGLHKYHGYWRDGHKLRQSFMDEFEGVKIHSVPMFVKMPSRIFKETYYERAANAVVKYVRRNNALHNADWIYAQFLTDNGFIAANIKNKLGLKLAAIARGDDIHAWPEQDAGLRKHLLTVFEKADLLLANSRNLGVDAQKWMEPGKIRKVDVVYNGIDHVRFRPVGSSAEQLELKARFKLSATHKYLVCVASPEVLKGWLELFEAISKIGNSMRDWKLLAISPPANHPKYIKIAEKINEYGINEWCENFGSIPPADMPDLMRACDAFVLPSHNEGMANSLLEAMASGLACIATEVGGHNEVIRNESNGLLIPPRNVLELVDAINTIVNNGDLRATMGVNARARMIEFGDYLMNGKKLLTMLENN